MSIVLSMLKSYWPTIASIVGGFALGFLAAWQLQGLKLDSLTVEFGQYRNTVEQQAVEARQAALKQKEQWIKEKEDAEQQAAEREATLRVERDRAGAGARRLRDDIATIRTRLPNAIPSAVPATADTLAALLDQCQTDYRGMAEIADGHASDVQTLIDAWPK